MGGAVNTETEASSPKPGWPLWALLGLTAVIYGQVVDFGLMTGWDDALYVLNRTEVTDWFAATWRERLLTPDLGYPVPLPTFLHYLTRQLPADVALAAAHGLSLAFHLLNVVLVYVLGRRWLGSETAAASATALWTAHPLLVESVAWVTDLKVVLLAACLLGAMLVWERHLDEPRRRTGAAVVLLALLGLGCRPEGVLVGPLLAGLVVVERAESGSAFSRFLRPSVWGPLAVVAVLTAVYLPVALQGQEAVIAAENFGPMPDQSLGARLSRSAAALAVQMKHVVQPFGLQPAYAWSWAESTAAIGVGAGLWGLLAALSAWTSWRFPPSRPGWLLWWALYLPASGVVFLPRFTADTYMYLPLAGLLLAGAGALVEWEVWEEPRYRRLGGVLVVGLTLGFGLAAHAQTYRWQNTLTLWKPVVEAQPENLQAKWQVAHGYAEAGEWERALAIYRKYYGAFRESGRLPIKMVEALRKTGHPRQAVRVLVEMLEYRGKTHPEAEEMLVELVIGRDIALSATSSMFSTFRRAVDGSLERGGLTPETCRELSSYLEKHHPAWGTTREVRACASGQP